MAAHIYRLSDKTRVPSVTTVIKHVETDHEGLLMWAWGLGADGVPLSEGRNVAANVGTIAHACIEADLKGESVDIAAVPDAMRAQVEQCLVAWRSWRQANVVEVVASEVQMVSHELRVGGTADAVLRYRGKRDLLDLKTGARLYPKDLVQIAAYGMMWDALHTDEPIETYSLLRLGKEDGAFTWHHREASSMEAPRKAFRLCREMYDAAGLVAKMIK